jgi:hypothetical protein
MGTTPEKGITPRPGRFGCGKPKALAKVNRAEKGGKNRVDYLFFSREMRPIG